jgi:hypothetical protein
MGGHQAEARTPAELEKIERDAEAEVREMNLAELRSLLGNSQVQLAELAKMSQGRTLPGRTPGRPSTFDAAANSEGWHSSLGGELEVRANFQSKSIRLLGV